MDAIKDEQSIRLLLYLTTSILALSVIIIGYFMTRRDSAITTATDNLTSAVQQLKSIVDSLQLQHEIRQPLIDAQLEMFRQSFIMNESIVKGIDTRLIQLETEHKLLTCKYPAKNKTQKDEKN